MSLEKRDWTSPECSPCIVAAVAWARRLTARSRRDRCRRSLKWPARSFPTNVHATDAARRATLMTMSWRRACSPAPETTRETERPQMSAKATVDTDTTTAHAIAPTNSQVSAPASWNRRFMRSPLSVARQSIRQLSLSVLPAVPRSSHQPFLMHVATPTCRIGPVLQCVLPGDAVLAFVETRNGCLACELARSDHRVRQADANVGETADITLDDNLCVRCHFEVPGLVIHGRGGKAGRLQNSAYEW